MMDLIGDLSLLNEGGHTGLPLGHIVAYKAGHELHVRFAQALLESCNKEDQVPAEYKSRSKRKKKTSKKAGADDDDDEEDVEEDEEDEEGEEEA